MVELLESVTSVWNIDLMMNYGPRNELRFLTYAGGPGKVQ